CPSSAAGGRAVGAAPRPLRARSRVHKDHAQPDGVLNVEIKAGESYGFLTATSVCIGCKACEVACTDGNQLEGHEPAFPADRPALEPACATASPPQSIQFGPLSQLQQTADARLEALHSQGVTQAQLYGRDDKVYGGLNAFFLLMDKPEAYGLPNAENAVLPSRNDVGGYLTAAVTAVLAVIGGLVAFRRRGMG